MARANVVSPKAKPFLLLHTFAIAVSVSGIVILKHSTAIIPQTGERKEKINAKSETDNETAAVLVLPNLSPRKPPRAFPSATAKTKENDKQGTAFQLKSITVPKSERITIVSIKQLTATRTVKDGFLYLIGGVVVSAFCCFPYMKSKTVQIPVTTGQMKIIAGI